MGLHLKLKPKTLTSFRAVKHFSSSSSFPLPPPHPQDSNGGGDNDDSASPSHPPPPPTTSYSSVFSDIKERLKSPPSPPRRIPTDPPPPPPAFTTPKPSTAASFEEIRKHLAEFRLKAGTGSPPSSSGRASSSSTISFQELFKNNVLEKDSEGGPAAEKSERLSFDSIRESLRKFRSSTSDQPRGRQGQFQSSFNVKSFQDSLRSRMGDSKGDSSVLGGTGTLPDSIFGQELREKKGDTEADSKVLKTELVKMYSYEELGEKLRKLRPQEAAKAGKDWFSLTELNGRLVKLRELEENEAYARTGGVSFRDLRESLVRLKEAGAKKNTNMQRLSILANIGAQATPAFMLKPPQEHLMENYFHPDHMSSGEKMKMELKKVRDEFKMSESDCGSARVQVAQLTTKIKHLSSVLSKKDKHSRKGLHDMVQRRKKLLKYLRRTDWDSYCLVLSKLGLRDVPEYKTPDYKT